MRFLFLALFLSGCMSVQYDGTEHKSLTDVSVAAEKYLMSCGSATEKDAFSNLKDVTHATFVFVSFKKNNEQIANAVGGIENMLVPTEKRYAIGNVSKAYCEEKAKLVIDASHVILKITGEKR